MKSLSWYEKLIVFFSMWMIIWFSVLLSQSKAEQVPCKIYRDEPVRMVCESQIQTCTYYVETGQMECVQK